jgi:glycosyltransferase involved in cell wall biosynthesis
MRRDGCALCETCKFFIRDDLDTAKSGAGSGACRISCAGRCRDNCDMKIAQVSPLYESVPPHLYGGTERVVSFLTEELVKLGHEVTLFASGDSLTSARLIPGAEQSLRLDERCMDRFAHHLVMLEKVVEHSSEFDVIHFHTDYAHFPISKAYDLPSISTLHGRLDIPDLVAVYRQFRKMPVVSISCSQRKPLPWLNWVGNVYHGVPEDLLTERVDPGSYLAFLGRISPEKRPDRAIEIALRCGMPLKIAAKVDAVDREYFKEQIKPLLRNPLIEFVGEITDAQKEEFLGNAYAFLFPIDWPEPFGLVMIEAMASGTPIIAFRNGSVPEIIEEGRTGFIVRTVDEAVAAVAKVASLSRLQCRQAFEERFTSRRMASDYIRLYEAIAGLSPVDQSVASLPSL